MMRSCYCSASFLCILLVCHVVVCVPDPKAKQLQKQLSESIRRGDSVFVIPHDVYNFDDSDLTIIDAHGMVIHGGDSLFVFNCGKENGFKLSSSSNLTLVAMSLDCFPKTFSQGRIIEAKATLPSPSFVFQADEGFLNPAKIQPKAPEISGVKAILWDPHTRKMYPNQGGVRNVNTIQEIQKQNLTFNVTIRPHGMTRLGRWMPEVGDLVTLTPSGPAIYALYNTSGITTRNMSIFGSFGNAISDYEGDGDANNFENIYVGRGVNSTGLLSTNEGGYVTNGKTNGAIWLDSEMGHMGDDFAWIHTKVAIVWRVVHEVDGGLTLYIVDPTGSAIMDDVLIQKDVLRFYDLLSYELQLVSKVKQLKTVKNQTLLREAQSIWNDMSNAGVPYEAPTPYFGLFAIQLSNESAKLMKNLTLTMVEVQRVAERGCTFRRCYFHDSFCNGIRLKSSNSIIENCTIADINALWFVVLQPCNRLLCGPLAPNNITITNNRFIGTSWDTTHPIFWTNVTDLHLHNNTFEPGTTSSYDGMIQESETDCWG
eukprot:m.68614 g.68614  ORF g.68614 m.68614 type:complete len:539 (+) comp11985_c0_seq1:129-1745(+)